MTDNPMELITDVVPELFNGALADMRESASGGNEKAAKAVADAEAVVGAIHVRLEGDGGGDVYLVAQGGTLVAQSDAPSAPIVAAVATPFEALEIALEEEGERLEKGLERLRGRLSRSPIGKLLPFVQGMNFKFHFAVTDTPDFDEVRTKVSLGSAGIPEEPKFSLIMEHDVFEGLQKGKIKPAALLSNMQIEGDASEFLTMVMDLATRAGKR